MLKLNPSKTEFILIRTKLLSKKLLHNFPFLIFIQDTNLSASAKNLGVVFDGSLNSENTYPKHVAHASILSVTCMEFEEVCH